MSAGDIYRATLETRYNDTGVRVNNVLWFRELAGLGSPIPESSLGQSLKTILYPASMSSGDLRNYQSTQYKIDSIRVQRMSGVPGGAVITAVVSAGQSNAAPVPSVCALDLKLQSTLNHRRGRGRLYLAGFAFSFVSGSPACLNGSGQWSSAAQGAVLGWADLLFNHFSATAMDSEGFEWGCWSKVTAGPTIPYNEDAFNPMADFATDAIIRCQRRREVGVGF